MNEEETVQPQEELIEVPEALEQEVVQESEPEEPKRVPLSALQKERQKRQELEAELRYLKEQAQKMHVPPPAEDESRFENATREDLGKLKHEVKREVEESRWIKDNPERFEKVNELLPEFLKRRPNLAKAIEEAPNRYEEAWELMDKLTPKQQQQLRAAPQKKDAPGNPASVPKGAAMNQAVDVMTMNDKEFSEWRKAQKRGR
jgi:hypothetical protein